MPADEKPRFRVIIVGGGITGLTLANSLQHAGVEFLVLETRSEVAPQVGASIGLAPNGSRILDQLFCYEDMEKLAEPVQSAGYHNANGEELCPRTDGFQLIQARTNYPVCFLDRQKVLQILAEHLQDPHRVLLNKKVIKIDHFPERVVVHCTDGTSYAGDIVVGADGVASRVRREMWRAAASDISLGEKTSMSAEYKCLFGISSGHPELRAGNLNITHGKDVSSLVIVGKGGRTFWFLFKRMSQIYKSQNIPRFTASDAEKLAQQHFELGIQPRGGLIFLDIWRRRTTFTLMALEEADFTTWTWGRFACVGDSVHKMTPNMGSGGMAAIESAAALANVIHSLVNKYKSPALDHVENALAAFQEGRKFRGSEAVRASNELTRIQAMRGLKEQLIVKFGIPYGGDQLLNKICDTYIGATSLDFLPLPARAQVTNMPLNPPSALVLQESKWYRALKALPFLLLSGLCFRALIALIPFDALNSMVDSRVITWGESFSFNILDGFYGIPILDDLARPATVLFSPSSFAYDPVSWVQMFTFLADIGVVYAIVLIESTRRANAMSLLHFPMIFGMASFRGIGAIMPVYYFLHFVFCPVQKFNAADLRLTDLAYTISILPMMLIGFYAPYFLAYLGPTLTHRHIGIWLWHMFPIWISLGQWILARTVIPNTMPTDRLHQPMRDIRTIRVTIGSLALISAGIYIYCLTSTGLSLWEVFVPRTNSLVTFDGAVRAFLQWDQIYFAAASLLWITYLFAMLYSTGYSTVHWTAVFGILVCLSAVLGTGAATAIGWLWREELLVRRRPFRIDSRKSVDFNRHR